MLSWRYRRLLRQAWHPSDEELLLLVEGEAAARSARRLTEHLSGCWSCRARRAEIDRAIAAYMAYHRDPAREPAGDDSRRATRRFAAGLPRGAQQGAAPAGGGSVRGDVQRSWSIAGSWRGGWTIVRVAAVVLAIVWVARWWMAPTPVSARELLARVDRAQLQELGSVADPVVYQRLRATRADLPADGTTDATARRATRSVVPSAAVSKTTAIAGHGTEAVTWEVWASGRRRRIVERLVASGSGASETAARASAGRVESRAPVGSGASGTPNAPPSLLLDLQKVLRDNGMEPGQPLSPASLVAWRRFAGHVSEEVRDTTLSDGTTAVTLTSSAPAPVRVGRIARAEVVVRTRDWHPVEHALTVVAAAGRQQRYTVTELAYRVVPLTTVDAAVFGIQPTADQGGERTARNTAAPVSPRINLAAAALHAQYALHTSGACLHDRVDVITGASGVDVRGTIARSRYDAVAAALRQLAHVRLRAEPTSALDEEAVADPAGAHARSSGPAIAPPAETAMQHIWAIRQLAEWYRATERGSPERDLDFEAAILLAKMIREHLRAALERLPAPGPEADRDSEGQREREAAPPAVTNTPDASGEPWTTIAMKAFAAVEYASRAGGPDAPPTADADPQGAMHRARALLASLDLAVRQLERVTEQPNPRPDRQ